MIEILIKLYIKHDQIVINKILCYLQSENKQTHSFEQISK